MYFLPFVNQTRLKFDKDFKACWSFCFEQKLLNQSKYSMLWVRCAFGNVLLFKGSWLLLCWLGWVISDKIMLILDEVGWIKETMRYSNYANYQKSPTPKECHIQSRCCLGQAFSMQMGWRLLWIFFPRVRLPWWCDLQRWVLVPVSTGNHTGNHTNLSLFSTTCSFSVTWFILIIFWE